MPQLSDTDPEQYNPLHQLDELADGDSCKKQRVQPSLLQQVVSLRHSGGSGDALPGIAGHGHLHSNIVLFLFAPTRVRMPSCIKSTSVHGCHGKASPIETCRC